jgi:hypothetical protein
MKAEREAQRAFAKAHRVGVDKVQNQEKIRQVI